MIGAVYRQAGEFERADEAQRRALIIFVRLGDLPGQAITLLELGNLYATGLSRPEEAVTFYRQSADKFVEVGDYAKEGGARNNIAERLRELGRLDEARQEIFRAIECKSQAGHEAEPWKSWNILANVQREAGNSIAAVEAKHKAIACYLAYRRDGGENYDAEGRISLVVTKSLLSSDNATAESFLRQAAVHPKITRSLGAYIHALQFIVAGSRDHTLADAPDLNYGMAAEILFLIETLEN
jgi:tetratricopeptide (TPR) repeat protein